MNSNYKKEIIDSLSDNTASVVIEEMLDNIGKDLSDIINLDGDEFSDSECLEQIIDYLKERGLYTERK